MKVSILTNLIKILPLLIVSIWIVGCETNGAEDTVVIFDEKSNDVTFANKKYNRKLAEREEQKWRDQKTIYSTGSTAANPAGGLEPSAVEGSSAGSASSGEGPSATDRAATQPGVVYNTDPNLRYGTDAPTDYEEYKRWRAASGAENSAEYQRFKLWQEFEDYRKWRESQEAPSE